MHTKPKLRAEKDKTVWAMGGGLPVFYRGPLPLAPPLVVHLSRTDHTDSNILFLACLYLSIHKNFST